MSLRKMFLGAAGVLAGCAIYRACDPKIPANVTPVENFDAEKYLGTWYEVGRVDNRFERGLIKTKAEYTLNEDGSINVLNSGFNPSKGRYTHASGTALLCARTWYRCT
ncbi:lipocalin family protein [Falsochrobactrum ovis]|uniref:lipocalin family protein n=1 Tax=Falsochrobactrum ovis TaxID=1293442 RepID=UPI00362085F5